MTATKKTRTISQVFWRLSLATVLALGGILGSLFVVSQYLILAERNRRMEEDFYDQYRSLLRRETERILLQIEVISLRNVTAGTARNQLPAAVWNLVVTASFETNGRHLVLDATGYPLAHPDSDPSGQVAGVFRDSRGNNLGEECVVLSKDPDGGSMEYFRQAPGELRPMLRMVYVKAFRPWNWIVGSEIPIEKILAIVQQNSRSLRQSLIWRISLIVLITVLLIGLSAAGMNAVARRLQNEMTQFLHYFKNIARSHREIDTGKFAFSESADLARTANAMNSEIRTKTQKLKKEIRVREQAQEELLKLSQAVEQSPAIVVITDTKGVIEYINPKFTETTGFMPSEAIGSRTNILRSGFQPDGFYKEFWQTLLKGRDWKGEFHNKKKNGELYWESALITGIKNSKGRVTHYLKVADDISERKRLEQNMEYLAHHDTLTGLPNRLLFADRVHHAIAHAHRHHRSFAVMILDLDNFKTVNDTLGHEAGDQLLKMTVKRFMKFLREEDTASRMGGDEFNLLVNDLTSLDALHTVTRRIVDGFRDPFPLKGKKVIVTPSIGIAVYPQDGTNLEDLVKNADIALYRVKNAGKNAYQLFSREYAPLTSPVSGDGKST